MKQPRTVNFTYKDADFQDTVYTAHYELEMGEPVMVKVTLEDSEERVTMDYYGYNAAYEAIEGDLVERSKGGYNE